MLNPDRIAKGIAYAEKNFQEENSHLKIDKKMLADHFLLRNSRNSRILDFGCGMGGMSLWLAKNHNCEVDGIDIDPNHIVIANKIKEKYNVQNVSFEVKNILEDDNIRNYDLILLNDVAEHIPLLVLEDILKILKMHLLPDGKIFLSYPPWEGPYASHLNHVISIPWCQFLPNGFIFNLLKNKNLEMVGSKNLKQEFLDLNHLNHSKISKILSRVGLKIKFRKSITKLNRISTLRSVNFNKFPFTFLVTKELLIVDR